VKQLGQVTAPAVGAHLSIRGSSEWLWPSPKPP